MTASPIPGQRRKNTPRVRGIRADLARWYAESQRDLPWRRSPPDPYAVWLSEIMLQQTTVAAVIPYFERFLTRFPNVSALAAAPLDDVLAAWAGLGYYRRARHLHAAARLLAEDGFPRTVEGLLELPGVGPYTAGAIASIAFDVAAPLVDGNVARVLSRLFRVEGDPRVGEAKKRLWELAAALVPEQGASSHNQGLMELGALVCTPTSPRCAECPLAARCDARAKGDALRFPELAPRAKARARRDLAVAVFDSARVLVGKRRADAVWGGLWELPRVTLLGGESDADAARRLGRELLACGLRLREAAALATTRHTVMRERIELRVVEGQLRGGPEARGYEELRWVTKDELSRLALSSPQRRVAPTVAARISERGK